MKEDLLLFALFIVALVATFGFGYLFGKIRGARSAWDEIGGGYDG